MIEAILYSHEKQDIPMFKRIGGDVIGALCEEDWHYFGSSNSDNILEWLRKNPEIDISCVDAAAESGVAVAETIREKNRDMFLIILADYNTSPLCYIRPSVLASSLLLRPLIDDDVRKALDEAVRNYLIRLRG